MKRSGFSKTDDLDGYRQKASALTLPGDPLWSQTIVNLDFRGTSGKAYFYDSTERQTWGVQSSPTTISGVGIITSAQSRFSGGNSLYIDTTAYLLANCLGSFNFGSGDATIELGVRFPALPSGGAYTLMGNYAGSTDGWALQFRNDSPGARLSFGIGDTAIIAPSWSPSTNTWYDIAYRRASNIHSFWVNGAQIGSNVTNGASVGTGRSVGLIGGLYLSGSIIQLTNAYYGYVRVTTSARTITQPTAYFPSNA